MRRPVLLLTLVALLAACGPAAPSEAPRLLGGEPAAPVVLPEVIAPETAAGADPLEDEAPAGAAADGPGAPAAVGAPPATLPTWLRPVRDVPPPSVIGTGRSSPKRVGLQVGHLANEDLPPELERLRASGGGATGGGYSEVQVNYDLAIRTAALLRDRGVEVDVLPATVPVDYQADAFVAIHADGDARGALRGFKIASSPMSQIPTWDEALVGWLNAEYARATGLPRDDLHISRRMLFYYAFNNRRYYHAIAPGTPAAIAETGFMTSAADRALLIGTPDRAAAGLANGILGFLGVSQGQ
jgi:hypothetical protein